MSRKPSKQARMLAAGDGAARVALDRLYAKLPTIGCKGECADSCGPIAMSRVEWDRMRKRGGTRQATSIVCPYLENERCSVYDVRPMICRLWGLVEDMLCPWGCEPSRVLTRTEAYDFLLRAELISEPQHAEEIELQRRFLVERPEFMELASKMFIQSPTKTH